MSSPLKRTGSKASVAGLLAALAPVHYREFRDPFCGSASLLEYIPRHVKRWLNDKDWRAVRFLTWMRDDAASIDQIMRLKAWTQTATAEELAEGFEAAKSRFVDGDPLAVLLISRYAMRQQYSVRRSNIASFGYSFIGSSGGSGFSPITRDKLERFRTALEGTKITCGDYPELLTAPGDGVWIYLDPPWATCPSTYDFNFGLSDHLWLRARLRSCPHSWLLSLGADLASLYPPEEFCVRRRIYKRRHPWSRFTGSRTELVVRPLRTTLPSQLYGIEDASRKELSHVAV